VVREGVGGEIFQALYAHMNNNTIKKRTLLLEILSDIVWNEIRKPRSN
jgi:hypothetical protein